jgi:hypothetical protein
VEDNIEAPSEDEDDVPIVTPLLVDMLGDMVELLVGGVPAPLVGDKELEMLMLEGLELPDGEVKAVVDDSKLAVVVKDVEIELLVEELPDDEITIVDGVNAAADILPEEVEELLAEDKVLSENRLLSDDVGPLCVEVEGELVEVVIMLLIEDDSIPVVKLLLVDNVELLLEEEIVELLPADVDEVPLAVVVVAELLLVGEIAGLPLVNGVESLDDVEREVEVEVELLELFAGKVSRSAPHILVEDSCAPSPFLR